MSDPKRDRPDAFAGYDVRSDERVAGGFLVLRRLRLRVRRADGSFSHEGNYDYIERPVGEDAIVLVLYHRGDGGVRVLLRRAPRVPLWFLDAAIGSAHVETVAGILEKGEDGFAAIQRRAAAEAYEEAGVVIAPEAVTLLYAPAFATPALCAELLHFVAAEVRDPTEVATPPTDGSPFEEGARLEWVGLDEAIARCERGDIQDEKTELGLRRLKAKLRL